MQANDMSADQSQQEERRRTREVRFDDTSVEVSSEYPAAETDDIWYSWNEVQQFIAARQADILRISQSLASLPAADVTNDHRVDMLGLWAFIHPRVAHRTIQNMAAHRNSVLGEHDRQASLDINEAAALCRISERHSRLARESAYQVALLFSNISFS